MTQPRGQTLRSPIRLGQEQKPASLSLPGLSSAAGRCSHHIGCSTPNTGQQEATAFYHERRRGLSFKPGPSEQQHSQERVCCNACFACAQCFRIAAVMHGGSKSVPVLGQAHTSSPFSPKATTSRTRIRLQMVRPGSNGALSHAVGSPVALSRLVLPRSPLAGGSALHSRPPGRTPCVCAPGSWTGPLPAILPGLAQGGKLVVFVRDWKGRGSRASGDMWLSA